MPIQWNAGDFNNRIALYAPHTDRRDDLGGYQERLYDEVGHVWSKVNEKT